MNGARASLIAGLIITASCAKGPETVPEKERASVNPALGLAAARAVSRFDTPVISVDELRSGAQSGALLVDVRGTREYAVSRIPGAVRWDFEAGERPPKILEKAELTGQPVVFYCSIGWRSGEAAEQWIASHPNASVRNLKGGIFAWAETGGPLEGGNKVHPYDATWSLLLPARLRAPTSNPALEEK